MNGACLELESPARDAISRIRFTPQSNNLLVSSWDSSLRLYDADSSVLRLEAPGEGALLDCCFQSETVAFSAVSDGSVIRYDLHSGIHDTIGNHDDLATCVEYSDETCQVISAGWDKKIMSWDTRINKALGYSKFLGAEVDSLSICVFNLMVAVGASVHMYDLRNLNKPVQAEESSTDLRIGCVRSIPNSKGYAVGSVDGRVALKFLNPSNSNDMGFFLNTICEQPANNGDAICTNTTHKRYTFRCRPKSKDGRDSSVAVNDIVFNPIVYGTFVTGNNEGYVTVWDAQSRRRILELPRYPNSVASLSYNYAGQLLAVASSYTYQEANEIEDHPKIYIHRMDSNYIGPVSAGSSSRK